MKKKSKEDIFTRFTSKISTWLGRPTVFAGSLALVVIWAFSGPLLGFSDTWQLIINTSTTVITFLVVFVIQNTQNRDNLAMNIKQDAIMDKLGIAAQDLIEAEDKSDKKLERKKREEQLKAKRSSRKTIRPKRKK